MAARGGTGETWNEVQDRVSGFISGLVDTYAGRRVAATSHGGAIKAYSTAILGLGYGKARLLGSLENTSVTQVAITPDGHPVLTTYNITHHLEDRCDPSNRLPTSLGSAEGDLQSGAT